MYLPQREEDSVMWKEKINKAKWKGLYLIRHGESTCNEVNRFGGAIGAPLTALGKAKKTHGQWRRRLIDVICVSPLLHAWIYENALYDDSADVPEGEHFETFNKRVLAFFLDELPELITQDQTVLVVAYQYVIELLSPLILGIPVAGGYDLSLPDADILNVSELGHYVHKKSRKMNLAQGWIFNVLMLGAGLALSQLSIVTDDFLPLIKLGYSLSTGLSIARVDMSSTRWSSNNGMFSLKRIFFLFSLAPLTVQELAPPLSPTLLVVVFFLGPAHSLHRDHRMPVIRRAGIRHSYDDSDRRPDHVVAADHRWPSQPDRFSCLAGRHFRGRITDSFRYSAILPVSLPQETASFVKRNPALSILMVKNGDEITSSTIDLHRNNCTALSVKILDNVPQCPKLYSYKLIVIG